MNYRFDDVTVTVNDQTRQVTSRWDDGSTLTAAPNYDQESIARAGHLGYNGIDPCWGMTRDHDLLHHVVAHALGRPSSTHLHRLANPPAHLTDQALWEVEGDREERLVLLLQAALNRGRDGIVPSVD